MSEVVATPVVVETVKIEVEVPKEAHELAKGIMKIIQASRVALADGFQPTQDLPVLLVEAVKELPAALGGVDKLGDEFAADKGKMLVALSLAIDEVL
jgi:hypothetical protein